jgi:Sporulation protein YhaL
MYRILFYHAVMFSSRHSYSVNKRGQTYKEMKQMTLPIWMYLVVAGIFGSAFMTIKSAKEEKTQEDEWIEKEGEVYIHRMEEEKEKKRQLTS